MCYEAQAVSSWLASEDKLVLILLPNNYPHSPSMMSETNLIQSFGNMHTYKKCWVILIRVQISKYSLCSLTRSGCQWGPHWCADWCWRCTWQDLASPRREALVGTAGDYKITVTEAERSTLSAEASWGSWLENGIMWAVRIWGQHLYQCPVWPTASCSCCPGFLSWQTSLQPVMNSKARLACRSLLDKWRVQ